MKIVTERSVTIFFARKFAFYVDLRVALVFDTIAYDSLQRNFYTIVYIRCELR